MRARYIYEELGFERSGDVKKGLGLGIQSQIMRWYDEYYGGNPLDYMLISNVIDDPGLEWDTRKKYLSYLLKDPKWTWDETDWYEMRQWTDFDVMEELGNKKFELDNITLVKDNDRYFIRFDDWEEFGDYFEEDDSKKFIIDVLTGNSYFEISINEMGLGSNDVLSYIERSVPSAMNIIKKAYNKLGGKKSDPEEMMDDIFNEYTDLRYSILFAISEAQSVAEENMAIKEIIEAIKEHFGFKFLEQKGNQLVAEITEEGAERLLDSYYLGESNIDYSVPYHSYSGYSEPDPELFREILEEKISEIKES